MRMQPIYVIHSDSKIESLYTLFPLLVSRYNAAVRFVHADSKDAKRAEGGCAILVRTFKGNNAFAGADEKKRAFINDFRTRFDRVVMLDDGAGSDSLHFEYMDLVELYYKGKLLRDRSLYLKPMYGRQLFTNYYHEKFGVTDEKVKQRDVPTDPSVLNKLRVSWNLGCGIYPAPHANLMRLAKSATRFGLAKMLRPWYVYSYKKMMARLSRPVAHAAKLQKIHARFEYRSLPNTIGYQRKIMLQHCAGNEAIITGKIRPALYNKEMSEVAAVLSPFGWGEVCFRDFEAIHSGSLLIKPDMAHVETWPDIYKNRETYLQVDWDGANLVETLHEVLKNGASYRPVIEAARAAYKAALADMDNRVLQFLEEASGQLLRSAQGLPELFQTPI